MTATVCEGYGVTLAGLALEQDDDGTGVEWHATKLDGWDAGSDVRLELLARSADHGSYPPAVTYAERKLTLEGALYAPSPAAAVAAVSRFSALTADLTGAVLRVDEPGLARQVTVWRAGALTVARLGSDARYSLPLVAPDPIRYAVAESASGAIALPGTGGSGQTYPLTYPIAWGTISATGDLTVTNTGDAVVWPVLTLTGPLYNPVIRNVRTGEQLSLTISLAAGDVLTIDTRERMVLLGGTASRRTSVNAGSRFPSIPPGASTFSLRGAGGTGSLSLRYRSGWV